MLKTTHPQFLKLALFVIFIFSGFSGLIYESIWSHYLKLMLGHAAYAQTLVLAIFMGGMALGAWLTSRYSRRWSNLLLGYAIAEGMIGLLGLVFHPLFTTILDWLYLFWLPALGNPVAVNILKWSIAVLLIAPQSILLGATFPLMSAGIIRLYPATAGATLGMLYFTNSLGAATGVLVSAFVLIPAVGLPGTILTAALINIALAVMVWALVKERNAPALELDTATMTRRRSAWVLVLLLIALSSSLASFCYEIGWIRMLSLVLGSSTQAFELMLSAFILGLALGGLWIRRRLDHIEWPLRYAGYVQILMGLFAMGTLSFYNSSFDFMAFLIRSLSRTDDGYLLFNLGSHVIAMMIMIPATFLAGMTLPLFTFALLKQGEGERSIGRVYSANTVGAIMGVLLAVHWIMPSFGVKGLVSLGALLDIVVGVSLLALSLPHLRRWELSTSTVCSALLFVLIVATVQFDPLKMSAGVYRTGISSQSADIEIPYYRDGKTATVALAKDKNNVMSIMTNGKPDAAIQTAGGKPTMDEITMLMTAVVPLSMYPNAKTAAVIGFGSGMTTHTLLGTHTLERVDTIEIEPFMVEAARGFGKFVERAYTDPRSHIQIEDAKTYFSSHNARYDLIISEPSNPWVSGVAGLFSEEFYRYIKGHLQKDGLLVQWIHLYELNTTLVSSVLKALSKHFDHYAVFNTDDTNILIVASNERPIEELDEWIFSQPQLKTDMARVGFNSLDDLQVHRIGTQALFQPLIAASGAPVNSDYFPYLSYQAPKARYLRQDANELTELRIDSVPLLEMLDRQLKTVVSPATATPYFMLPTYQKTANQIADALLLSQPADLKTLGKFSFLVPFLKRELATDDAAHPPSDELVRSALFDIAMVTNPFLTADRIQLVWAMLINQPAYGLLSPQTKSWIALYQAVGARDGLAMGDLATGLINTTPKANLGPNEAVYLLTAGLTGYLAVGDKAKAQELLKAYGRQQSRLPALSLPLQLLIQLSSANSTTN